MKKPIVLGGITVAAGQRRTVQLPVARLYTHTAMTIPVHVVNGREDGPVLLLTAAIHGDELNGIEIIRRLLRRKLLHNIKGAVIAVPVVNIYGFLNQSRYLPDRRDLNRCFPGAEEGSLASQLANLLMTEIVSLCTHAIDLHTGSNHRGNLPQIRARVEDAQTLQMAQAFGAPVILPADSRDGSLRQAVLERGIPMLLYEAGEPLRLDDVCIRAGLRGILNVMRLCGMIAGSPRLSPGLKVVVARRSSWMRAPVSGMLRSNVKPGRTVKAGDEVGVIVDPFGGADHPLRAPVSGLVIGDLRNPLVHRGDAVFHLAAFDDGDWTDKSMDAFNEEFLPDAT